MEQAYGLVAMRLYITEDPVPTETKSTDPEIPSNISPFLRTGRPNLPGLVEQAAEEAGSMGRLGVAVCGTRGVNIDVKNACVTNLRIEGSDIYCHAEEFEF